MSVIIWWKDKDVLSCANWAFRAIYDSLINLIEEDNIKLNHDLRELIEDLDQGGDGIGLDISDYMFTKEDSLLFINLIDKAIIKLLQDYPGIQPYKHLYENFYKELLKAHESFCPDLSKIRSATGHDFYLLNSPEIAAILKYKKKYILTCKVRIFSKLFRKSLLNVINKNAVILNEKLKRLIEIFGNTHWIRLDLSEYIQSKEDFFLFKDLIRESMDTIYRETADNLPEDCEKIYENFYSELVKISESFPS